MCGIAVQYVLGSIQSNKFQPSLLCLLTRYEYACTHVGRYRNLVGVIGGSTLSAGGGGHCRIVGYQMRY